MAKKLSWTTPFDLSPDELVQVLVNPDFHRTREKELEALDVRVEELSRDDKRLRFEVHTKQYARGKTGIDRSRTEMAVTTYDWDLERRESYWSYKDPHSSTITVEGNARVESAGQGSTLIEEMRVEVRVPLIGKQIEKLIVHGIEKGRVKYEKVLRQQADKARA